MYNFNQSISRIGSNCTKWDRYANRYHIEDVIPLWVADMDFTCLAEVKEAIIKRAEHQIYGYTDPSEELYAAIINWEKRQHGIEVEPDDIVLNTGVVYGFYTLIDMLVQKHEKVIVQNPVYPPFFNTPYSLNRDVVFNPLCYKNGHYYMDLEDFEQKLKEQPEIRMFIMCNPHNPTGQCHTLEEINSIMEICERYNVWVVSDEIHADIIMPNQKHISSYRCDERYWNRLILLGSPTKTFNLAGLKISYAIVKNHELQKEFARVAKANGLSSVNIFGIEALIAAYTYGDQWREECCLYIYENFLFLKQFIEENMPLVKFDIPEATYLAWLDFTAYNVPDDMAERLKYEGHVELQAGIGFGMAYSKYQRVNVACPRSTLEEGMKRVKKWLEMNQYL